MQIICNSFFSLMGGHNSVVEYKLPKLGVASSNLVARSIKGRLFMIKVAERRLRQCGSRCQAQILAMWV
jgi:hypothetical protein